MVTFKAGNKLQKMIKSQKEKDIVIVSIQSFFQVDLDKYVPLLNKILKSISDLQKVDKSAAKNDKTNFNVFHNSLNLQTNKLNSNSFAKVCIYIYINLGTPSKIRT